jgi:hypothetical protein
VALVSFVAVMAQLDPSPAGYCAGHVGGLEHFGAPQAG